MVVSSWWFQPCCLRQLRVYNKYTTDRVCLDPICAWEVHLRSGSRTYRINTIYVCREQMVEDEEKGKWAKIRITTGKAGGVQVVGGPQRWMWWCPLWISGPPIIIKHLIMLGSVCLLPHFSSRVIGTLSSLLSLAWKTWRLLRVSNSHPSTCPGKYWTVNNQSKFVAKDTCSLWVIHPWFTLQTT